MPEPPPLTLFGIPALAVAASRTVFTTERPFQLLAYLACRGQWVRRDELADVLWPDHDAAMARSNLRKVLLLAQRVPGVGEVERRGDLLRWNPDSDLRRFEAACEERRFADAAEAGGRPLLEGYDDAYAGTGAEWLVGERQRTAGLWQGAAMQRLNELAGQPLEAALLARRMLQRDPLDEAAVTALAQAHLALGEGEVAAAAIAAYARRLDDQLGLELPAGLRALQAQAVATPSRPAPLERPAAVAGPAFIGRRVELARIVALLAEPRQRLVTLTGPGGIGKSSTAVQVGASVPDTVAASVVWVPLADLTDAAQVPSRLAGRLGKTLAGDADPWAQLDAALADSALLLLIDNAEHLDIAAPLGRLLAAAPKLKLLVTSRARLGLDGETVVPLEGLPLPDDDETDVEVLRRCDAVALFEARALAAAPRFNLAAHAGATVRLLHLVEGMPLAIEWAATWTRLLAVEEIADDIARSVDLLESDPAHERGLRASFAQSWRLLGEAERACLPRLAVLAGDFSRDLARQVAGATLPVLSALVDKSLLRADGDGRFAMHAQVRKCALEQAGDAAAEVEAKLAAFVARWLGDHASPETNITAPLLDAIDRDVAHVRAAWRWATEARDGDVIARMARTMSTWYEERGLWAEGMAALDAALRALEEGIGSDDQPARGAALRGLAIIQYRAGRLSDAEASATQLVGIAEATGDDRLLLSALNTQALSRWQQGRFEEARDSFVSAVQRAEQLRLTVASTALRSNLATVYKSLGRYADALAALEEVVDRERSGIKPSSVATGLNNIANVLRALNRPEQAIERLHEALALCEQASLTSTRSTVKINLGLCHVARGDAATGRKWLGEALRESRQSGEPHIEMAALLGLAELDAADDFLALSRSQAWQALSIAQRTGSKAALLECVAVFGVVLVAEGRVGDGIAVTRWAMAQPMMDRLVLDMSEQRIAMALQGHPDGGAEQAAAAAALPADAPFGTVLTRLAAPPF